MVHRKTSGQGRVVAACHIGPQPFQPGDKVWTDFASTGHYLEYTVKECYLSPYACETGWLVSTVEGIRMNMHNNRKIMHGIDSNWFKLIRPEQTKLEFGSEQ